jgi:hypothetical protein
MPVAQKGPRESLAPLLGGRYGGDRAELHA